MNKKTAALWVPIIIGILTALGIWANTIGTENTTENVVNTTEKPDTTEWSTYRNDAYGFEIQYPPSYYEDSVAGYLVSFFSEKDNGQISHAAIHAHVLEHELGSFDTYKQDLKDNSIRRLVATNYTGEFNQIDLDHKEGKITAEDKDKRTTELTEKIDKETDAFAGQYSFQEDTLDGIPVIFHKRNFYGMIGNVYEMYVGLDKDKVLIFTSEEDNSMLEKMYRSFKKFD